MKCEKCGKEIPEGENKICDECKKNLLNELENESKTESTESKKEEKVDEKVEEKADEKAKEKADENIESDSKSQDIQTAKINTEIKTEKKNDSNNKSFVVWGIIILLVVIAIVITCLKGQEVADKINDFIEPNTKVGNSIANIRNYGYSTKKGSWIYYIAGTEDGNKPAIYRSKKDGSNRQLLFEKDGNILSLNVYDNYIYFILMDNESLASNSVLSEEESLDTLNNKIYRMKLDGSEVEVINDNEFHNNCYEVYVVDDKVYYIGLDTNIYYMNLDGSNKTKLNDDETGYLGITEDYIILNVVKTDEKTDKSDEDTSETDQEDTSTTSTFETQVMKRDGTDLHKLTGERLYSINVVGDYIYYVDENKNIGKIKMDGTENQVLSKGISAYNMNISDKYIFYMNYTSDTQEKIAIYRMNLDGSNNTEIYTLDSYSSFLNVVDGEVVFMDSNDEAISINIIDADGKKKNTLYELKYSANETKPETDDEEVVPEQSTDENTDTEVDNTTETTDETDETVTQ